MPRRLYVFTAFVVLLAFPAQEARAQFGGGVFVCANCSDEGTTLIMKAQQVMQYLQEVQTALSAIQMAAMMVKEGQYLAQHPHTNVLADLSMLSSILVQAQGVAGSMAQMDAQFRGTYAPYNPSGAGSYAAAYNNWATTTLNTLHGVVNAAGMNGNMLQNEQMWTMQMQALNQTPMGRNQALQLGNTIALEEIAQLQRLRQLMAADMTSKAVFSAQMLNTQLQQQSAQTNTFKDANWTADQRKW